VNHQGRFIVFEGLDGAGTTTQAKLLSERLQKQGRIVYLAHQPSEGPAGLLIRQILAGRAATTGADGKLGVVDERVMACSSPPTASITWARRSSRGSCAAKT